MLLKKTKYLMKNLWVDGNEVLYRETKEFWPFLNDEIINFRLLRY